MTTTKMLIAMVVFCALVVGGMIYYRYRAISNLNLPPLPNVVNQLSLTNPTVEGRLTTVEDALAVLINKVNTGSSTTVASSATVTTGVEGRIQSLENTVANLQVQINQLKSGTTEVTTEKSPLYIPLGTGGVVNSRDWITLDGYQVTIDSSDYPGYSGAYLEINMRLNEPKATKAFARLYNSTDGSVTSGEVSTTATIYSLASTSSFQLASGKKTYKLQIKSTDTGEIFIQDARIKITF